MVTVESVSILYSNVADFRIDLHNLIFDFVIAYSIVSFGILCQFKDRSVITYMCFQIFKKSFFIDHHFCFPPDTIIQYRVNDLVVWKTTF